MRSLTPLSPPHETVSVSAETVGWGYYVHYRGPSLAVLLAAGCITQMMVDRIQNPSKGRARLDEEGDKYYSVKRPLKNQPERVDVIRCVYTEDKAGGEEKALALPGVREYLEAHWPESEGKEDSRPWHHRAADTTSREMGTTDIAKHNRVVGRFRRVVSWRRIGILLIPDWASIKAHVIANRST